MNTKAEKPANMEMPANEPERGGKVDSTFADSWEYEKPGDTIKGRYLGYEEAPGRNGTFRAHQLMTAEGRRSMAGAHLDSMLSQIPKGTFIWVTYKTTKKVKNGEMAIFDVEAERGVKLIDPLK